AGMMQKAKVVVTPTKRAFPEGRCMAAMEALAVGVPVVAPNYGPFPYLVTDNENGRLYEPDSVSSLRQALEQTLTDKNVYENLAEGARQTSVRLVRPAVRFSEAFQSALKQATAGVRTENPDVK
ncbi:MAG: glycosyltransferase, partial [Gammaproteobacteria bacterium]